MKWITKHIYVDLETGEELEKLPQGYYKAKLIEKSAKTIHNAGRKLTSGIITLKHAIRRAEYSQQQIFTNSK